MSAAKHTPGPWYRMDKRYDGSDRICLEICTFSDGGFPQQHIARVNHCDTNPAQEVADTVAANARLIAAAPSMLEALRAAQLELEANKVAMAGPEWAAQRTATGGALLTVSRAILEAEGAL